MATEWRPQGDQARGERLRASGPKWETMAISPIRTPADPQWQSKPSSLEAQCSTEAFDRLVGWVTSGYHWSVVRSGRCIGSGDVTTVDEAKAVVDAALGVQS